MPDVLSNAFMLPPPSAPVVNPLTLPLLQPAQVPGLVTLIGSFLAPSSFNYYGAAISVSGNTLYISSQAFYNSGQNYIVGLGAMTMPAITPGTGNWATPSLTGGNGQATELWGPLLPSVAYDSLTYPGNGAYFPWSENGGSIPVITGSLVYNGKLYATGAISFDSSVPLATTGCVVGLNTDGTNWGIANTPSTPNNTILRYFCGPMGMVPAIWQPYIGGPCYVCSAPGLSIVSNSPSGFLFATFDPATYNPAGGAMPFTELLDYYYSGLFSSRNPEQICCRSFSGPFPLAGGGYPATLTSAPTTGATTCQIALPAGIVVVQCNVTQYQIDITSIVSGTLSGSGVSYKVGGYANANWSSNSTTINITSVTSGLLLPNTTYYAYDGIYLPSYTSFTTGSGGGPGTYTLSANTTGPSAGEQILFWPSPILNGSAYLIPALERDPGTTPGTGSYFCENVVNSPVNGLTIALTPTGYGSPYNNAGAYWQMTFSDGEIRVGQLDATGNFPSPEEVTDVSTFAALNASNGLVLNQPLTGSGFTTSVTVNPLGDNYLEEYDAGYGYGFIWPGTRTLVNLNLHSFGLQIPRSRGSSPCDPGGLSSANNEAPCAPDANAYRRMQLSMTDMADLVAVKNGQQAVYASTPYNFAEFPNWRTYWGNCASPTGQEGTFYFDPATNYLYCSMGYSGYSQNLITVFQITPVVP